MNPIEIKSVTNVADVKQIEDIQRIAWGMDDLEVIPGRFLHALQYNGACLYGAYDGDKVVGFVFGLLGTVEGLDQRVDQVAAARLMMYSTIMGVLPEYQQSGIGYRLKVAQREFALRIGVRLISWTYDPLESRNGHFNISKLGVVCHRYLRDFHGEMGGLNLGLPTDRFYVEWWVTSNRVKTRLSASRAPLLLDAYLQGGATIVNAAGRDPLGLPVPPDDFAKVDKRIILTEIPAEFQRVKQADMELAVKWRQHSRQLFEYYFDRGFLVTDFVRARDGGGHYRSYYVLTHGDS